MKAGAPEANEQEIKNYSEMDKYAFISLKALENNFVGYCYREYSEIKIDSGWRFLYGDEDEDYLDNPDNSDTKDLTEVLALMPELQNILCAKRNSEFEWNTDTKQFEQI